MAGGAAIQKFVRRQRLIREGENVNKKVENGFTPMHRAEIQKRQRLRASQMAGSAQHILEASGRGDTGEVERLIREGEDVNKKVENGCTPLHYIEITAGEWRRSLHHKQCRQDSQGYG